MEIKINKNDASLYSLIEDGEALLEGYTKIEQVAEGSSYYKVYKDEKFALYNIAEHHFIPKRESASFQSADKIEKIECYSELDKSFVAYFYNYEKIVCALFHDSGVVTCKYCDYIGEDDNGIRPAKKQDGSWWFWNSSKGRYQSPVGGEKSERGLNLSDCQFLEKEIMGRYDSEIAYFQIYDSEKHLYTFFKKGIHNEQKDVHIEGRIHKEYWFDCIYKISNNLFVGERSGLKTIFKVNSYYLNVVGTEIQEIIEDRERQIFIVKEDGLWRVYSDKFERYAMSGYANHDFTFEGGYLFAKKEDGFYDIYEGTRKETQPVLCGWQNIRLTSNESLQELYIVADTEEKKDQHFCVDKNIIDAAQVKYLKSLKDRLDSIVLPSPSNNVAIAVNKPIDVEETFVNTIKPESSSVEENIEETYFIDYWIVCNKLDLKENRSKLAWDRTVKEIKNSSKPEIVVCWIDIEKKLLVLTRNSISTFKYGRKLYKVISIKQLTDYEIAAIKGKGKSFQIFNKSVRIDDFVKAIVPNVFDGLIDRIKRSYAALKLINGETNTAKSLSCIFDNTAFEYLYGQINKEYDETYDELKCAYEPIDEALVLNIAERESLSFDKDLLSLFFDYHRRIENRKFEDALTLAYEKMPFGKDLKDIIGKERNDRQEKALSCQEKLIHIINNYNK